jgi:hypothetical protein
MHTRSIFILERKEGETTRETEKESASVGALRKDELGIRHKTNHWEKPS